MSYCPVCNGIEPSLRIPCSRCGNSMVDQGRYSDYFDDYSPYEEIDSFKMVDGIEDNKQLGRCAHYLTCHHCEESSILLVQERV